MRAAVLYHPHGAQGYTVSRARDCRKVGIVTRISQDWRSRHGASWRFESEETGAFGTVRTRDEAAQALLEVFEWQESR